MRTHYYPSGLALYDSEGQCYVEQASCGTWLGEASNLSGDWGRVDCASCLKRKTKIITAHAAEERAIVSQMGDMAAFMRSAEQEQAK